VATVSHSGQGTGYGGHGRPQRPGGGGRRRGRPATAASGQARGGGIPVLLCLARTALRAPSPCALASRWPPGSGHRASSALLRVDSRQSPGQGRRALANPPADRHLVRAVARAPPSCALDSRRETAWEEVRESVGSSRQSTTVLTERGEIGIGREFHPSNPE
jgi:hypothetical protein